ncbi:hypothetical protein [Leifsonia sp. Root4]|uniref:hypothetical protein n=1 Tax=Leifsonia sp. Root4 TaxID=1736525 RepID=UPI0012FB11E0|nr:hypothetical protein [Leifsonia sp. Root4]
MTEVKTLLSTLDYPAHPSDLLREAARDGISTDDMEQQHNVMARYRPDPVRSP